MRILLILPDMGLSFTINHGVTAIAGALKAKGYDCKLIHIKHFNLGKTLREIMDWNPDVVGVTLTENHYSQMKDLCTAIKSERQIKIFWGGAFPSAFPAVINECACIDGVCQGEGEISFVEVLSKIEQGGDYYSTRGFWFRRGSEIIKNPPPVLVEDLDTLPMPDIRIHPQEAIQNYPAFSFSRGCPFKCTYCCAPLFQKRENSSKPVRYKSPIRAIAEIKEMLQIVSPEVLFFDDDTFFKSKKWLLEFLELYNREIKYPFVCNTRPETINEKIISMMKNANCSVILIGIESGSEPLRTKTLGRKMKNSTIIEAFNIVKKYRIKTSSFNMVGIPGETMEHHKETIAINKEILPDFLQITAFYPYRGTYLGDYAYMQGYVKGGGRSTYFGKTIMELPDFPKRQVEKATLLFKYNVYKDSDYKKALKLLVAEWLRKYPVLYNPILFLWHFLKRLVRK